MTHLEVGEDDPNDMSFLLFLAKMTCHFLYYEVAVIRAKRHVILNMCKNDKLYEGFVGSGRLDKATWHFFRNEKRHVISIGQILFFYFFIKKKKKI